MSSLDKDTWTAIGLGVTAFIGLLNLAYSFANNRRSSYVGSVTATRLRWITEVRDRFSSYVALIYQLAAFPAGSPKRDKLLRNLVETRMLLRLQLAPAEAPLDALFEAAIESAFSHAIAPTSNTSALLTQVGILVQTGQHFLWQEWRKVKSEAIYGDPYDTFPRRITMWLKRWETD